MVDRNNKTDAPLIIADRGYESFNALAHIQEKGWKFLFRIKDADNRGGIANGLDLHQGDEYDISIVLHLSAGRIQEHWKLYKNKNTYKRISHPENFDFFINESGERDVLMFYHLPFRILKIKGKLLVSLQCLPSSSLELLYTYKSNLFSKLSKVNDIALERVHGAQTKKSPLDYK